MKSLTFRLPAFIAAAVCFTALMGSLANTTWWRPFFFAFLPAAFFVIGGLLSRMHRDNSRLRRRLSQLEQRFASIQPPGKAQVTMETAEVIDGEEI